MPIILLIRAKRFMPNLCRETKRLSQGFFVQRELSGSPMAAYWVGRASGLSSCSVGFGKQVAATAPWLGLPLSGLSVPFYTAPSSVTPVGSLASPAESAGFSVALVAAPPQLPPMWLLRLARFLQASLIWLFSASSFQHCTS